MIGIVGPHDSVTLAQHVAVELGRSSDLLCLAYEHAEEAVGLARTLDASCDVLVFTGQVPYQSARLAGPWRCDLQVISHSGADLYRMIGLILKERQGEFPRVSVDALEAETVRHVFRDMQLPIPEVIIPVLDDSGELIFEGVKGTARTHLKAIKQGVADAALTCLAETHTLLVQAGAPSWRIEHARVTIAEALQRAWLTSEVARSKGNSLAIAVVEVEIEAGISMKRVTAARAGLDRAIGAQALKLSSHLQAEENRYILTLTQAAVHTMIERHRDGQKSLLDVFTRPGPGAVVTLGIGIGHTYVTARDSADKAVRIAAGAGAPAIAYSDGSISFILDDNTKLVATTLQETSAQTLDLVRRSGLGPLSLRRLADALGRADGTTTTAQQLGEYYGVMPRSARRMLAALVAAGYAREVGVRAAVGAGRPHVVYDVDLARLRTCLAVPAR